MAVRTGAAVRKVQGPSISRQSSGGSYVYKKPTVRKKRERKFGFRKNRIV